MNRVKQFEGELIFNSYVIGYRGSGESILFTLEVGGKIRYSGLIDCYEVGEVNETERLLIELGIAELDLICWTHPHDDHTKGLKNIIDKFTGTSTLIVYPMGVYSVPNMKVTSYTQEMIDVIKSFETSMKQKIPQTRAANGGTILRTEIYSEITSVELYEFKIITITPAPKLAQRRIATGIISNRNDFSISLLVQIGGFNFFFGGDIQDESVRHMPKDLLPEQIDYVKIPHHGSKDSLELLELDIFSTEIKPLIACTTEYRKHGLPKDEVLQKYGKVFKEVYCTNESASLSTYGCVHTRLNVLKREIFTFAIEGAFNYSAV